MVVIPGGCTPYLQAGDIGIFRILKDNLSETIKAWKILEAVEYTQHGNPRAPAPAVVEGWFRDAWQKVSDTSIKNSDNSAGFASEASSWHVAKHDVYGEAFLEAWENASTDEINSNIHQAVQQAQEC